MGWLPHVPLSGTLLLGWGPELPTRPTLEFTAPRPALTPCLPGNHPGQLLPQACQKALETMLPAL